MQIEGLIPFKSSTDKAIASLYFLRISNSFCSSSTVNAVDIITGFAFSVPKKEYFKCLGNSFKVNLFLFLLPFLHCCLIILYCSHSNLRLLLLNHIWNSEIHNQDPQDTGNSSHFH